jgi:hypothetical protein
MGGGQSGTGTPAFGFLHFTGGRTVSKAGKIFQTEESLAAGR